MAKYISEAMIALRLIWLRVCLYFLLPFLTVLANDLKDWTGEVWDKSHWFDKSKMFIPALIAGGMAIGAFIDQSLNKAKETIAARRADAESAKTGVTAFFTQDTKKHKTTEPL